MNLLTICVWEELRQSRIDQLHGDCNITTALPRILSSPTNMTVYMNSILFRVS